MPARSPNFIDQFTDYRRYIAEALERRDRRRTELAEALGMSDSMLSQVLSGKRRLRASLVPVLADFFELNEDERHMLEALVDPDNESAFARRAAWSAVQARQRYLTEGRPSDEVVIRGFSLWYVPAVYELARCVGFRADPIWISRVLEPPIQPQQAEEALQTLLALGLLQPTGEGILEPVVRNVWADGQLVPGAVSDAVYKQHL